MSGEERDPEEVRFWFDVFSAVVLLATAVIGAWLPRYLSRRSSSMGGKTAPGQSTLYSTMYHLGNCLSGGVMLSAGFCHLLADAQKEPGGLAFVGRFPMANFLAALGLLVTMAADQVVQFITEQAEASASKDSTPAAVHSHGMELVTGNGHAVHLESPHAKLRRLGTNGSHAEPADILSDESDDELSGGGSISDGKRWGKDKERRKRAEKEPLLTLGAGVIKHDVHSVGGQHAHQVHVQVLDAGQHLHLSRNHSASHGHSQGGAQHDCAHGSHMDVLLGQGKQLSFATTVLLACALCVHSVLEGMALGAQANMRKTQDIMIAIAAHKGLAAYALGASVVESKASAKRFWTVIMMFSLASPVGIFIGLALSSGSSSASGSALSALASGTFLYVAMMEVIPRELGDPSHRLGKLFMLSLGFGLMSLLAIWA